MQNETECRISCAAVWLVLAAACSDSGPAGSGSATKHRDASAPADPCPHGKLDGSYEIMNDEDAAAIADCTEISGDLSVSGDALTKLSLPKLKTIGGALLLLQNPKLKDVDLGALTRATHLGVQSNNVLTTLSLPKLRSVGVFVIAQNAALTTARFESLTTIESDGFIIRKNPVLATLSMPLLTTLVGDIIILDNPMLPSCQIDALAAQFVGPPVPINASGNDDTATCP